MKPTKISRAVSSLPCTYLSSIKEQIITDGDSDCDDAGGNDSNGSSLLVAEVSAKSLPDIISFYHCIHLRRHVVHVT
jgi:hypothetical protein